jgi:hypothetical protein
MYNVVTEANFPFSIEFSGTTKDGQGLVAFIDTNIGLAIFIVAIAVNL